MVCQNGGLEDPSSGLCNCLPLTAGAHCEDNWRDDEGFDEQFVVRDGDAVMVTKGYHSTVACPTSHMYFLNYLAGDLLDDARATPPCFHSDYVWIHDNWDVGSWRLPVVLWLRSGNSGLQVVGGR